MNQFPDSFIQSYCSFPTGNNFLEWVSARFSPNCGQEDLLAIGAEDGSISLCNAKEPFHGKFVKQIMKSHTRSVIFDVCFLPDSLVSLSGNSHLELWDLETGTSIQMVGHKNSVRCSSIWPEKPYLLVSGSRDGSILCWDLRVAPTSMKTYSHQKPVLTIHPQRSYLDAHEISSEFISSSPSPRRIPNTTSITGLLHLGENHIISASSSASSGIRIWDMRYQSSSGPIRTLTVPNGKAITCLCWDRFRSSMFASCTDNKIHEYMPSVNTDMPVRTLNGQGIDSFYVQCAASPISDHLICGSFAKQAFIWDLQQNNRNSKATAWKRKFLPDAKFSLGGHESEVECVQWSQNAKYMLTMSLDCLRLWSNWTEKGEKGYPEELIFNGRPMKMTYPTILPNKRVDLLARDENIHALTHPNAKMAKPKPFVARSPLKILDNLPTLYLDRKLSNSHAHSKHFGARTPRKIVIKWNNFVTPASKIPSAEGYENLPAQKTPRCRRNLSADFQKQKTPGSSAKKRRQPPASSERKPKISRRSLHQSPKASTSGISSPNILKYFSPISSNAQTTPPCAKDK